MGGKGSRYYANFVQWCMKAHKLLRNKSKLFITLFSMVNIICSLSYYSKMLISGMPELQTKDDIMYVVDTLSLGEKNDSTFESLLEATGSQISTRVNFFIHNLVH